MEVRDVLGDLGVQIMSENRRGKDGVVEFTARCPHHFDGTKEEHSGSWSINSETGAHICYACDFRGSLEYLIEKVGGVDKATAKKQANTGARALRRVQHADPWNGERPVEIPPMNEARIQSYDEPPQWALDARHVTAEAAAHFSVRWDSKRDAWILPIRDPKTFKPYGFQMKGQINDADGNRLFRNLPAGVAKSATLFGVEHLNGGTVIVVESPLDVVYLWALGFQAVAIMGRTISDDQWDLLISRADRLILALDNDVSGVKEMMRVIGRKRKVATDGAITWVRAPYLADYSQRIPIRLYNYDRTQAKDPGDQEDVEVGYSVETARTPLSLFMPVAS